MAGKKGRAKKRHALKKRPARTAAKGKGKGKGSGRGKGSGGRGSEKAKASKPKKATEGRLGLVTQWRRTRPRTSGRKGKGKAAEVQTVASFKRPDDAVIIEAIKEILIKHRVVHSQEDLRDLVMERLREKDPLFKIGGERIRHLALNMPEVRVHVDLRVMEEGVGHTKCPVCDTNMRPDKNQTVYGGVVTTGFSCPRCGYRTGLKHRSPTRYTFSLKGSGASTSCPSDSGSGADITKFWAQDGSGQGTGQEEKGGEGEDGGDGGEGGDGGGGGDAPGEKNDDDTQGDGAGSGGGGG